MSYEERDASLAAIGLSAALLAALVAVAIGVSVWFYATPRGSNAGGSPDAGVGSFTHGPDERIGILVDYDQVVRAADARLHTFGWVDEKGGIARIPIDRAMALTAAGVKPAPAPKEPGAVP